MARSNLVNAVDVALAADVAGADPTIQVTDPDLLPAVPFYLVIDPFGDSSREYLRATSLAVDVLSVERNLDGSQSTTHTAGDIVRISYVAQHLSDMWDEFGSYLPLAGGHMTGGIHFDYPNAGYATLTVSSGDDRRVLQISVWDEPHAEYVQFNLYAPDDPGFAGGGFAFVGPGVTLFKVDPTVAQLFADLRMNDHKIRGVADPSDAQDAATKAYVDAVPVFSGLHADLTDVTPDQHHTRYTDAEAVAAVGTPWDGIYLPLTGGILTGPLKMGAVAVDPWNSGNVLGHYGAMGTQGSNRMDLTWNWLRTATGYESLGAGGATGASAVSLGADIQFRVESDWPGTAAPATRLVLTPSHMTSYVALTVISNSTAALKLERPDTSGVEWYMGFNTADEFALRNDRGWKFLVEGDAQPVRVGANGMVVGDSGYDVDGKMIMTIAAARGHYIKQVGTGATSAVAWEINTNKHLLFSSGQEGVIVDINGDNKEVTFTGTLSLSSDVTRGNHSEVSSNLASMSIRNIYLMDDQPTGAIHKGDIWMST